MGNMLLSYSAMQRALRCPREWAYKYIDKIPVSYQSAAMDKGRFFHAAIETNDPSVAMNPELTPFDQQQVYHAAVKYLEAAVTLPKPTVKEVKLINEEHGFIGYLDSITINTDNSWLIGEMKTTSRHDPVSWAMHEISLQTALYKAMSAPMCHEFFISPDDFKGTSFKEIRFSSKKPLKGRGKNAIPETPEDYGQRIKNDIVINHQIFGVNQDVQASAMQTFNYVKAMIKHLGNNSNNYPKCQGSCRNNYGSLCDYIQICWPGFNVDTDESTGIDYEN